MSTARNFDANEALSLGIVNEVVDGGKLERRVEEIARFYANMPSKVIGYIKQLLDISLSNNFEEHLMLEERLILDTAKSKEFWRGCMIYLAKLKARV